MSDIWENLLGEATGLLDMWIGQGRTSGWFEPCESPIEQAFYAAVQVLAKINGSGAGIIIGRLPTEAEHGACRASGMLNMFIAPQFEVPPYRADFLMGMVGAGSLSQTAIIVECDGHQWHEKTAEQARRDKERDRALNTTVAKVIRFTGSEIYRSPLGCAEQAMSVLDKALFAYLDARR